MNLKSACLSPIAKLRGVTAIIMFAAASAHAQSPVFRVQQYPLIGNTHVAADLNGDARLDLAGANGNAVSVMLGNGDGTFRAKTDFPLTTFSQAVAAGDFNGDGKIDLAVTLNSPQLSVALLTGTGTGTFNAPVYFPNTSGFDSPAIIAADLNNDGKLDVVIMHSIACFTAPCTAARSISVLLGNGNGTFQPAREINAGTAPYAMAVGDFNRDGIKDLAIGGGNTELSILLGVGDGSFLQQPVMLLVPGGDIFSACNDVAVADLNRDGIQDLVVALGNGNGNAILLGNGTGSFSVVSRIVADANSAPLHVAVADYNGDGIPDIARAMGDGTTGLMQVMLGNGNLTFQAPVRYLVPAPSSSIAGGVIISGDWNNDGKADIALQVTGASPGLDVLTNATGAAPAPAPTPPPAADTVGITRAEYDSAKRVLRIQATSTRATATLQAFVTSNAQLIGTLTNNGAGSYSGQFALAASPQNITVRSSLGGSASAKVAAK